MKRISSYLIRVIAVGLASFHIYTAYFGTFYPYVQRSVPVMLALILTFLTFRARNNEGDDKKVPFYDWALALLTVPAIGYVAYNSEYLANRWPMTPSFPMTDLQILWGVLATLLILEATRRVLGWLLVIVAVVALLYTYLGDIVDNVAYWSMATALTFGVRTDLSNDVVYNIAKALANHKEEFWQVHKMHKFYQPEVAWKNIGSAPLHPGAAKFYKEKGYMP